MQGPVPVQAHCIEGRTRSEEREGANGNVDGRGNGNEASSGDWNGNENGEWEGSRKEDSGIRHVRVEAK